MVSLGLLRVSGEFAGLCLVKFSFIYVNSRCHFGSRRISSYCSRRRTVSPPVGSVVGVRLVHGVLLCIRLVIISPFNIRNKKG